MREGGRLGIGSFWLVFNGVPGYDIGTEVEVKYDDYYQDKRVDYWKTKYLFHDQIPG